MKCSVCAQDIPEDRYSDHLESEHGVTDDPTAVLIQHLTGLRSRGGEEDGDDGLPDEEPSDADAFEEFLAEADSPAAAAEEVDDEDAADEPEAAAEAEPEAEEADSAEGEEGEDLTDEDEAEFERMLATYPDVDLRKGRPAAAGAAGAAGAAAAETEAAAARQPETTRVATADRDETTFAVWDEARGATDDEDALLVVPPAEAARIRRRRTAALLGLGAAIILVAIAVVYLLTRDDSSKNTTATAPVTTTPTTVAQTFLPGPQGGAPTTVAAPVPTQPPATKPTPATTAAPPPTTAAPSGNPAANIAFKYIDAQCIGGQLAVHGTTTNNNPQTYTFRFTVQIVSGSGAVLGTANGGVDHLASHATAGFTAAGTCTDVTGGHPTQQITSITPG